MKSIPPPHRSRLYTQIFWAAAVYNAAFGIWAAIWPASFFDLFDLAPATHPAIWRCLGMVIGLYGAAYAYAAVRPGRARIFIAIGLAGKVLGPIGWVSTVWVGEWPVRTFPLIVFNDLIWWVPFALFLMEGWSPAEKIRSSARICARGSTPWRGSFFCFF